MGYRDGIDGEEKRLSALILQWLGRWLQRALDAVLEGYRRFGTAPDPHAIFSRADEWTGIVETRIIPEFRTSHEIGWESVLPDSPLISTDSFIQAQIAQTRNLLVRIPDDVYNLVFAEISDAVNDGDPLRDIAARVEDALTVTGSENWPNRAKVIAVTEANRAGNAAALAAGMQAERIEGISMVKEWLDSNDRRVRPEHHHVDGQQVPLSQPFLVDGFPLMYPGDPAGPPHLVINCVPGSSRIRATNIEVAYKFHYVGPLVTLRGENGLEAAVSPHHPVLTERGWLPAIEVQEGDYLLRAFWGDGLSRAEPHVKTDPPTAEEVFSALAKPGVRNRVMGLAVDFHGDVPDGEVEVHFADRKLHVGVETVPSEVLNEILFASANAPTAGGSLPFQLAVASLPPPAGRMGWDDLLRSLLRAHPTPLQRLGLTSTSEPDPGFTEATRENRARYAEKVGELIHGGPPVIAFHKVIGVDLNTAHDGPLYTFQTYSGTYIADGIVSHNCRCSTLIKEASSG